MLDETRDYIGIFHNKIEDVKRDLRLIGDDNTILLLYSFERPIDQVVPSKSVPINIPLDMYPTIPKKILITGKVSCEYRGIRNECSKEACATVWRRQNYERRDIKVCDICFWLDVEGDDPSADAYSYADW